MISGSILGNDVKRLEDPRFITGQGLYLDDIRVEGVLHLKSVRSIVAHGVLNMPLTPGRVWQALNQRQGRGRSDER